MSIFMKTMAAKNPIAALRKEGSPLYVTWPWSDEAKANRKLKKSMSCPGGTCRPDRATRKAIKQRNKR